MKKLGDLFHAMRGLDEDARYNLEHAKTYLEQDEQKHLEYLLKFRQAGVDDRHFGVSAKLLPEFSYPVFAARGDDAESKQFVAFINDKVEQAVLREQFAQFAKHARDSLCQLLAPNILGMDFIKQAVVLQLATPERIHILLLGDPGTGKTEILRSAAELAHKSSFGLGSGASKAGLSVSFTGKEKHEGLLVQASGGLCCIDELNLMKSDDRAALYNAMEKGFITYDKGAVHERFEADVRMLATANPTGDQFRGHDLATLKRQLPFDSALLSRFHLVFLVRRPDVKTFRDISSHALKHAPQIVSPRDVQFIHQYLEHARLLPVSVPEVVEQEIVDAVTRYKSREKSLLTEVTPRLAKGMLALTCARARLDLRTDVTLDDARAIILLIESSFPAAATSRAEVPRGRRH